MKGAVSEEAVAMKSHVAVEAVKRRVNGSTRCTTGNNSSYKRAQDQCLVLLGFLGASLPGMSNQPHHTYIDLAGVLGVDSERGS